MVWTSPRSWAVGNILTAADMNTYVRDNTNFLYAARVFPGTVAFHARTSTPSGWLTCDGTTYTSSDYPDLFAAIGQTFGGSGSTFKVPDLRGRAPIGVGTGSGLTTRSLGGTVGTETHTLTESQMPSHNHSGSGTTSTGGPTTHYMDGDSGLRYVITAGPSPYWLMPNGSGGLQEVSFSDVDPHAAHSHTYSLTTTTKGSDGSHNNMQPSIALRAAIKT